MKRSEVKPEYRWKLEDIYPTDKDWEDEFSAVEAKVPEIASYRGKLSSRDTLLACLRLSDEISKAAEKLFVYARMRRDEDSAKGLYVGMSDRADTLLVKFNAAGSFITSELSALDEKTLRSFIADPDFSDYDYMLSEIIRSKAHILSEKEEKILALAGGALGMFQDVFMMIDNVDLPFPTVKVGDEEVKLTHGKYSLMLQNRDQSVRKTAFDAIYKAYGSLINTITANYTGNVKQDNFYAAVRGYDSPLEKALDVDNIPPAVYDNLIEAVGSNLSAVHDYVALRKKALALDELHMYDMYVPIVDSAEISVPYDEAFELVLKGLAPMGDEYLGLLKKARSEGWIDVEETENKRSGAYSWGAYTTHPYVLLNYTRTTHDVFTVAHELGHALHSYYSDSAQPYAKAGYAIFVAEVASTINEVLLLKHLIAGAKDPQIRKYLYSYYLDMFRTTLYRQTMFAEFELTAHKMEKSGEALTVDSLSEAYYALNKKYYGPAVVHDDMIRYEWARIPHFYNAFYVYKYATGLTSAVNIARNILEKPGFVDQYKKFLRAGGSMSPYEILKIAGVDLATKAPYEAAAEEFRTTLAALKKECGYDK